MKIIAFFKSPTGNLLLFLAFLGIGGLMLYRSNLRDKMQAKEMSRIEQPDTEIQHVSIVRTAAVFKPTPLSSVTKFAAEPTVLGTRETDLNASTPPRGRPVRQPESPKPRLLPLSLIAVSKSAAEESGLSKTYAPYGRLIPCETVITLESSQLDTPVIGLVTDDVWHNGKLIIPAGAEVHGRASLDRSRERIAVSGRWVVVWRDSSDMNGTELVLSGIALERDKNDISGEFGMSDGSAGLIGDLLRTDNLQEVKLFASTFLAGIASGLQKTQTQTTALGITQITTGSARDGALRGTADVLNAYARQIQEAVSRDGFFVRVPAGKQFYIYVTETIDQAHATRGNRNVEDLWKKSHEN